jgi:hypothetical protein
MPSDKEAISIQELPSVCIPTLSRKFKRENFCFNGISRTVKLQLLYSKLSMLQKEKKPRLSTFLSHMENQQRDFLRIGTVL